LEAATRRAEATHSAALDELKRRTLALEKQVPALERDREAKAACAAAEEEQRRVISEVRSEMLAAVKEVEVIRGADMDALRQRMLACEAQGHVMAATREAEAARCAEVDALRQRLLACEAQGHKLAAAREADSARVAALEDLRSRISVCEGHGPIVQTLREADCARAATLEDLRARISICEVQGSAMQALTEAGGTRTAALEELRTRICACERQGSVVEALRQADGAWASTVEELKAKVSTCEGHGSSIDSLRQADSIRAVALEELRTRIHACEGQGSALEALTEALEELKVSQNRKLDELESLKGTQVTLVQEKVAMASLLGLLKERVDELEGSQTACVGWRDCSVGASEVLRAELMRALRQGHAAAEERLICIERRSAESAKSLGDELRTASVQLQEAFFGRLHDLEQRLAGISDQRSAAIDALRELAERLRAEASEASHASEERHQALKDRFDFLENMLSASTMKHGKELESVKSAQLTLEREHNACRSQLREFGVEADALKQRIECLELSAGKVAELCEHHAKALEVSRTTQAELGTRARAQEMDKATLMERLATLEEQLLRCRRIDDTGSECVAVSAATAGFRARLEALERLMGEAQERQATELKALQAGQATQARELEDLRSNTRPVHESSAVLQKVSALQRSITEASEKQDSQLANAGAELEQLRARVAREVAAREAHRSSVSELVAAEKEAREAQYDALQVKLDNVEDCVGRCERSLDDSIRDMKADVQACLAGAARLGARMSHTEARLNESMGVTARRNFDGALELDHLYTKAHEERLALNDCLDRLRDAMGSGQSTQDSRTRQLESWIRETLDKLTKETEVAHQEHTSLAGEVHELRELLATAKTAQELRHASILESVCQVQTCAEKCTNEVAAAKETCQRVSSEGRELRASIEAQANRLERLECSIGCDCDEPSVSPGSRYSPLGSSPQRLHVSHRLASTPMERSAERNFRASRSPSPTPVVKASQRERPWGSSMQERLASLEAHVSRLATNADVTKEAGAVLLSEHRATVRVSLDEMAVAVSACEAKLSSHEGKIARLAAKSEDMGRLMEQGFESQAAEMEALKAPLAKTTGEAERLNSATEDQAARLDLLEAGGAERDTRHNSLKERVGDLERSVGCVGGRLEDEWVTGPRRSGLGVAAVESPATLAGRLKRVEGTVLGDATDERFRKMAEELRIEVRNLSAQRLDNLERSLATVEGRSSEALQVIRDRMELIQSRLSGRDDGRPSRTTRVSNVTQDLRGSSRCTEIGGSGEDLQGLVDYIKSCPTSSRWSSPTAASLGPATRV